MDQSAASLQEPEPEDKSEARTTPGSRLRAIVKRAVAGQQPVEDADGFVSGTRAARAARSASKTN